MYTAIICKNLWASYNGVKFRCRNESADRRLNPESWKPYDSITSHREFHSKTKIHIGRTPQTKTKGAQVPNQTKIHRGKNKERW